MQKTYKETKKEEKKLTNTTQIKEKNEVNKCKCTEDKIKVLINLIAVILKLFIFNGIKAKLTSGKFEEYIERSILCNQTVNEILNKYFIIKDEKQIEKTIIACYIICKGSLNDTQDFLKDIYNYNCSIGKISNVIKKYSVKARKFNESIDLSNIKVGANDEIFKASKPVLVGVEPKSNYIYLMELEEKRDGVTWWFHLEQKSKYQGLKLDKSINDAGKGLNKGINDSFDNKCKIQPDLFHCKRDFSRGVKSLERKAYSKIEEEYKIQKKYLKNKCDRKIYRKIINSTKISIDNYDNCHKLFELFDKCTKIGGYNYLERKEKLNIIILELEKYKEINSYIKKFYNFLENNSESLLMFVEEFYYRLQLISLKENIDPEVFKLMWKQYVLNKYSEKYNKIEIEILNLIGNNYTKARNLFNQLIEDTIRASSSVENINSLLRPYLDLKKSPNQNFLNLMQLYFNTRKFKRSNLTFKIGYSPLELYTKKDQLDFMEILGF